MSSTPASPWSKIVGQHGSLPPRLPTAAVLKAAAGGGLAILCVALLTRATASPLILGSLGASCVFVFGLPDSPFAQPRNVVLGHVFSSALGLAWMSVFGREPWVLACALACAIAIMFLTRTVHAPAGSNPVIIYLSDPGWNFLLTPTLAGACIIVAVAVLYNNLVRKTPYPVYWVGRDTANPSG